MDANFKEKIFQLVDLKNPPGLALRPRTPVLGVKALRTAVESAAIVQNETLLGLLLLWHDHWNESHALAQSHEGVRDFDLLHAIGHRREGDYDNSSYWFNEAGKHPMFGNLSVRIRDSFKENAELLEKILPGGNWNPTVFTRWVKQDPNNPVLRTIQAVEMHCFLGYLISGAV